MHHDLTADVRYAARALRHAPSFTLVAVLTLALGIGANTAIFSVVYGVLLRPLPYAHPESLVSVWDGGHSLAEFVGVRDRNRTLVATAAYRDRVGIGLSGDAEPVQLAGAQVTADLFRVLGKSPALGRGFTTGEDLPGNGAVVVLSDALWRARFGADPSIIGRTIELDGAAHTVIGVMPPGFWFPRRETQLWVPLSLDAGHAGPFWGSYGHFIVGRLRPGVRRQQSRADVRAIAEQLRVENPVWRPSERYYFQGLDVIPLDRRIVEGGSRRFLLVLLGAVGMVLIIACANVANLLIARGAARERELSLRAALGAGRLRLIRQLMTESVVLAAAGGLVGLGFAFAGVRALLSLLPPDTPRLGDVSVSGGVLAFTDGLALAAGIIFGLTPALRLSRPDLVGSLGEGASRGGSGRQHRRLAAGLVVGEIALAVVLAVGAGLLLKSFARLLAVDPGFRTEHIVTARVSPPKARWSSPGFAVQAPAMADRQRVFYGQLLERVRAEPAVADVAVTNQAPFEKTNDAIAMWVDGYTTDQNSLEVMNDRRVSPGFFRAMGIPLLEGRGFTAADREDAPLVAVIDAATAAKYWKGSNPIGGRMHYPWPGWITIVGVVGTAKTNDLTDQPQPTFYVPFAQYPQADMTVVARTTGDAVMALGTIRAAVHEVAPDVPVSEERTMSQRIADSVARPRFVADLLLAFGGLALLLGAVGTYGLVAYNTQRRTRELAVRMALGARARDVLWAVVREGAILGGGGVLAGLALALALTRFLRSLLFEVSATDPPTFALVACVLGAAALLASYLPARRATRLDPMIAIRAE
jgi:putative ABC transport system permease protein